MDYFCRPIEITSIVGKHELGMANGEWRMASGFTRHSPLVTRHSKKERCQSGRSSTLGKRVYRKVPRVRIPPSPPGQIRRYAQNTEKARKHCVCGPFSFLEKTAKKRQKTHKNTRFFSQN